MGKFGERKSTEMMDVWDARDEKFCRNINFFSKFLATLPVPTKAFNFNIETFKTHKKITIKLIKLEMSV